MRSKMRKPRTDKGFQASWSFSREIRHLAVQKKLASCRVMVGVMVFFEGNQALRSTMTPMTPGNLFLLKRHRERREGAKRKMRELFLESRVVLASWRHIFRECLKLLGFWHDANHDATMTPHDAKMTFFFRKAKNDSTGSYGGFSFGNADFSLDLYSNLSYLKNDNNQREGENNEVRGDD